MGADLEPFPTYPSGIGSGSAYTIDRRDHA